jgi:hypothetical protein
LNVDSGSRCADLSRHRYKWSSAYNQPTRTGV